MAFQRTTNKFKISSNLLRLVYFLLELDVQHIFPQKKLAGDQDGQNERAVQMGVEHLDQKGSWQECGSWEKTGMEEGPSLERCDSGGEEGSAMKGWVGDNLFFSHSQVSWN